MVLFVLESNFILLFLGYGTVKIKFETSESQHIFIYSCGSLLSLVKMLFSLVLNVLLYIIETKNKKE